MIISRSCATNPLWITLMTEELRIFGDFRNLDKKIDQISDSVESLLTAIINRLINEDDEGFVKQVCIYLGEYPCKTFHCICCCVLPSIQKHKSR